MLLTGYSELRELLIAKCSNVEMCSTDGSRAAGPEELSFDILNPSRTFENDTFWLIEHSTVCIAQEQHNDERILKAACTAVGSSGRHVVS